MIPWFAKCKDKTCFVFFDLWIVLLIRLKQNVNVVLKNYTQDLDDYFMKTILNKIR